MDGMFILEKFKFFSPLFRFLLQCLEDLDASLRKLNSRLFVIRGQPANVFPRLFKVSARENVHCCVVHKHSFCQIRQKCRPLVGERNSVSVFRSGRSLD